MPGPSKASVALLPSGVSVAAPETSVHANVASSLASASRFAVAAPVYWRLSCLTAHFSVSGVQMRPISPPFSPAPIAREQKGIHGSSPGYATMSPKSPSTEVFIVPVSVERQ